MAIDFESIAHQALSLSTKDRAALVDRLLESLNDVDLSDIDQAWIDLAERRYGELRSGKVSGIAAEEVFSRIRS